MRRELRTLAVLLALALPVVACGGGGGDDDDDDTADAAQAADAGIDGTPVPTYPEGPYGWAPHNILENVELQGWVDSAIDTDVDPFNEPVRGVKMEEFYAGNDPDAKVLWLNGAAGWCTYCREEATQINSFKDEYYPRGVRIVTAIVQDDYGNAADQAFAYEWGTFYDLEIPTLIDPQGEALIFKFGLDGLPANIFICAADMSILIPTADANMDAYREILEIYLQEGCP